MPTSAPSDRPLIDKLGVKPGQRVSVVGINDAKFLGALQKREVDLVTRLRRQSDLVIYFASGREDLERLPELRGYIKSSGAIWVVREKGANAALRETDVIDAALRARLVDNKIASFSSTQAAMRLVIRLADR